jgi:peptidyl-tRNA hydrolase
LIDYVLQKFSKEDLEKINNMLPVICNVIDDFVKLDFEVLMSKYNGDHNE